MTPSNDPPEIPSLKPSAGKDDEKKGGGLLPSASSASKPASSGFKFPGFGSKGLSAPNLRVRGMGGGSTVMDRLKNLRKKDLIFIAAGLCTLGMAPLAEHLLMSPDEQTGRLQEGFDSKGPLFADGSTVYEQGSGVGSPGGLVGQGTDVITPLNVRDPSNLVMSPGATKKPDAVVAPPPPPPSTGKSEPDWRDVLKDSAKSGASAGTKSASKLPKPNVKMAGAIRGLSALGGGGGGTGASLKLDPLKATAPNKAAASNALTRSQATPGFRGATSRSNSSSGAGEALRAAGMRQSDIFNRGGSAANALETASKEAIPTGGVGSGGGGPGKGDETKNPGGNNVKESKQLGESLAFLRQKMEMEKSIDLKWKKKEWNQFGRQKMMEESAIKMGFDMFGKFAEKAFVEPFADMIAQQVAPGPDPVYNCEVTGVGKVSGTKGQLAKMGFSLKAGGILWPAGKETGQPVGRCSAAAEGTPENPEDPDRDASNPDRIQGPPVADHSSEAGRKIAEAWTKYCTGQAGSLSEDFCKQLKELKVATETHLPEMRAQTVTAVARIADAYQYMQTAYSEVDGGLKGLGALVGFKAGADKPSEDAPLQVASKYVNEAAGKTKATQQEESLGKAKTEGVDKAIGQGQPGCPGAQGGMADACRYRQQAPNTSNAAKGQLTEAQTAVTAAETEKTRTQTVLGRIAAVTGTGDTVLTSLKDEVGRTLERQDAELTKAKGYLRTAVDIRDTSLEGIRTKVFDARDGVYETVAAPASRSKALVNAPSQGNAWTRANPAATPPVTDEQAGLQNQSTLLTGQSQQLTQELGTAVQATQGAAAEAAKVKQRLDTCSKGRNFGCESGGTAPAQGMTLTGPSRTI